MYSGPCPHARAFDQQFCCLLRPSCGHLQHLNGLLVDDDHLAWGRRRRQEHMLGGNTQGGCRGADAESAGSKCTDTGHPVPTGIQAIGGGNVHFVIPRPVAGLLLAAPNQMSAEQATQFRGSVRAKGSGRARALRHLAVIIAVVLLSLCLFPVHFLCGRLLVARANREGGAPKSAGVCVCARGRAQAGLADARTSDALGQSSTARSEEPVKKWPGVSFGAVGLLSLFLPFLPFLPLAIARAASPAAQQAHSRERNRATECDRAPAVPTTACACLSAPGPGLLARH